MGGVEGSTDTDRDDDGPGGSAPGWRHRPPLRRQAFPKTSWGHRGYDEPTVDAFVRDATIKLSAADREVDELRSEIDRLHRYIRRQWQAIAAAEERDGAPSGGDAASASPAAQARAVLAHANEIAQRHIAAATRRGEEAERQAEGTLVAADAEASRRMAAGDAAAAARVASAEDVAGQRLASADAMAEEVLAEAGRRAAHRLRRAGDEARRVLTEARDRYEELVVRSHGRADQAAAVALAEFDAAGDPAAHEARAAYLQSFADVSRAAVEAVLDSSVRAFDELLAEMSQEEA